MRQSVRGTQIVFAALLTGLLSLEASVAGADVILRVDHRQVGAGGGLAGGGQGNPFDGQVLTPGDATPDATFHDWSAAASNSISFPYGGAQLSFSGSSSMSSIIEPVTGPIVEDTGVYYRTAGIEAYGESHAWAAQNPRSFLAIPEYTLQGSYTYTEFVFSVDTPQHFDFSAIFSSQSSGNGPADSIRILEDVYIRDGIYGLYQTPPPGAPGFEFADHISSGDSGTVDLDTLTYSGILPVGDYYFYATSGCVAWIRGNQPQESEASSSYSMRLTFTPVVPEPTTLTLLAMGIAAYGCRRHFGRAHKK